MPSVPKTSPDEIVAAALQITERDGEAGVSMQSIAKAVGIAAPSLYKHFPDRAAILRAVATRALDKLNDKLARVAVTRNATNDLRAMALAQRSFAHRSPHLYALLFGPTAHLDPEAYAHAVRPLLDRLRAHGDPDEALPNARLFVAFTHGFVAMELAGAFRLGGNLDAAFASGIDKLLATTTASRRR